MNIKYGTMNFLIYSEQPDKKYTTSGTYDYT